MNETSAASTPSSSTENSPAAPGQILMVARHIEKVYQDANRQLEVLKDVNLEIQRGEILAIMGTSGVGKSTLLHILGLLDSASRGELINDSRDLTKLGDRERAAIRAREFGFVFQMFHLFPDLDAQENAMLPALVGNGFLSCQRPLREARKRSAELLARLGLGDRLRHRPSKLSGGEKQRVAIARALMNTPKIVYCDEPTGNLDPATSEEIFQLILDLNRENRQTFVLVTHDARLAAHAHRIFRVEAGLLVPISRAGGAE